MKNKTISESGFYMWRTLFAVAHADGVVTNEEIRFMAEALEDMPFSPEQKKTLSDDIKTPQDPLAMFEKISSIEDQARFFQYARDMVHADGDYGRAEQNIMLKLQRAHMQRADVDQLVGKIKLEFEDEKPVAPRKSPPKKKDILFSFRQRFLEGL